MYTQVNTQVFALCKRELSRKGMYRRGKLRSTWLEKVKIKKKEFIIQEVHYEE